MRTILLPLALLALVACGDDDGNNPAPPTGRYALVSIAGDAVPVAVSSAGGTTNTIESGTLDIEGFVLTLRLRSVSSSGTANTVQQSAVLVRGNELCLERDGSQDCAAYATSGATLTVQLPAVAAGSAAAVPWVFTRQ